MSKLINLLCSKETVEEFQGEIKKYGLSGNSPYDISMLGKIASDFLKCQSPIEAIFYLEFIKTFPSLFGADVSDISNDILKECGADILEIKPQFEIETEGLKYRADFAIVVGLEKGGGKFILIELDGHQFHEKTNAQAQRDKFRDRMLQKAGYPVLHFTGSEVYGAPEKVMAEIIDFIKAL